ncbi:MAG: PASTA domain-containing protein [Thermoleophilia bacterium]
MRPPLLATLAIAAAPPPEPEAPPEIRGGARVGNRVSCQVGPWFGSPTIEVAWLVDGIENGAANAAYRVTARDVGHALQCKAIGSTPNAVVESFSAPVVVKLACVVPKLRGLTLAEARARLERARCRVGRVTRTRAKGVAAGEVVSSKPTAGKSLAAGAKVALVLAR